MQSICSNPYIFDKHPFEKSRLACQGVLLKKLSYNFLSQVGLLPGLRALDLGCGTGEFTFLVAEVIGESGKVVGIDRSVSAIQEAKIRLERLGYHNVSFVEGDIETGELSGDYDVVTGRFILSYLNDPELTLRKVCNQVKGVSYLAFQEWQLDSPPRTNPVSKCMQKYHKNILETLRRAGVDMNMGRKLAKILREFSEYDVYLTDSQVYEGDMNDCALLEYITEIGRALLKSMIDYGIIKSSEEFERLKSSAFEEMKHCNSVLSLNQIVGVAAKLSRIDLKSNHAAKSF